MLSSASFTWAAALAFPPSSVVEHDAVLAESTLANLEVRVYVGPRVSNLSFQPVAFKLSEF